jgi:hypothetical protein
MPRLIKRGCTSAALAVAAWGLLLLSSAGCKHSTTPESTLSDIVVTNSCGASINVYLDGTQKATIDIGAQATVSNVAAGSHLVEAKKGDNGAVVLSTTVQIEASTTTYVTVEGAATVRVTNQYGEILGIYDGDSYVGDIGNQITQDILKVTFGSHDYKAEKKTDGTVVSEVTIDVADVTIYTWIITP